MKLRFLTMVFAVMLLVNLVGCNAAGAAQALESMETSAENLLRRSAIPGPTEPDSTVTQNQAENIALNHAGFTADQVTGLRTEYEVDDGVPQYDVEFYRGDWEYEFEISAEDGRIISYDRDHKYD